MLKSNYLLAKISSQDTDLLIYVREANAASLKSKNLKTTELKEHLMGETTESARELRENLTVNQ